MVKIETVSTENSSRTTEAYLTVYSKKDVSVNTKITSSQVETALGVLPYEYLQAVGNVYTIESGLYEYPICAGYFLSNGNFWGRTLIKAATDWESCGSSYTLTVVGKK